MNPDRILRKEMELLELVDRMVEEKGTFQTEALKEEFKTYLLLGQKENWDKLTNKLFFQNLIIFSLIGVLAGAYQGWSSGDFTAEIFRYFDLVLLATFLISFFGQCALQYQRSLRTLLDYQTIFGITYTDRAHRLLEDIRESQD